MGNYFLKNNHNMGNKKSKSVDMDAIPKFNLLIPKSKDEVHIVECIEIGYMLYVPKDVSTFRKFVEVIVSVPLDDWKDEEFSAWAEKNMGAYRGMPKEYFTYYTEEVGWKYKYYQTCCHENGRNLEAFWQLQDLRTHIIANKEKFDKLDVVAWMQSISDRIGGFIEGGNVTIK